MELHAGRGVGPAGEGRQVFLHHRRHLTIQFHGVHSPCPMNQGLQHVTAGAGAKHQDPWLMQQNVRQGRRGLRQVGERRAVAIVAGDGAGRLTIHEQADLGRRPRGGAEAQARRQP